ncbi:MAG: histidinol-phosphatase HisJ [Vulcanibacillus sp.]
MLIDYHTHHERCGHATGVLREYVEYAIKLKLDEIGLSDHMPIIHIPKHRCLPGLAMELNELENYVQEVLDLKHEYRKDIVIRLGLEADYIEGYEDKISDLLKPYPFDYLIGSVHFLGEWDISDSRQMSNWQGKSIDKVFTDYYEALQGAAKSGLYDIIGHFDVIKKHGHIPKNDLTLVVDKTLMTLKEQNLTMEINPSGLSRIHNDIYPTVKIIERAIEYGIPFTLGSDAHEPEHVHKNIDKAREILENYGIKEIVTFNKRKRSMVPL